MRQDYALAAALLMSAGFLGARFSMATSARDYEMATGMAAVEFGPVLYLKGKGTRLEIQIEKWRTDEQARTRAELLRHTALQEHDGRLALQHTTQGEIARIEEENLKGRVWGSQLQTAKALALSSMRSAYIEQVALNRTASFPEETTHEDRNCRDFVRRLHRGRRDRPCRLCEAARTRRGRS